MNVRDGSLDNQLMRAAWRKSSYSGKEGNCVEVASLAGATALRDSHDPEGPALAYPTERMTVFLTATRNGSFDVRHA